MSIKRKFAYAMISGVIVIAFFWTEILSPWPSSMVSGRPSSAQLVSNENSVLVLNTSSRSSNQHHKIISHPSTPQPVTTIVQLPSTRSSASEMQSWKPGSFCDDLIEHTLRVPMSVCVPPQGDASISCWKNPKRIHMARCSIRNLGVLPMKLYQAMLKPATLVHSQSIWLIDNTDTQCPTVTLKDLSETLVRDYMKYFMEGLQNSQRKSPSYKCKKRINEIAFFYEGYDVQIFLKVLAWYNLHKSLLNNNVAPGDFAVVRLNDPATYSFADYERKLFPEVMTLKGLSNIATCFRKVVLVPQCFASVPFKCKVEGNMSSCLNCDGKGLYGTTLMSFRERVLKACSLIDLPREQWKDKKTKNVVVILRKDHSWKSGNRRYFERALSNSKELLNGLRKAFPSTNVTAIYMEDLPICEQIRSTHNADVLIGVHGAGLVHLWWIQEEALTFEFVPKYKISNPTFKVLSALVGRNYYSVTVSGKQEVAVNVSDVVKTLISMTDLR